MRFVIAYEGLLNVASLNLERAAEIRKMPVAFLKEDGEVEFVSEVPAISGVMLKHWHFRNLVELSREDNDSLCLFCNRLEAIRIPPRSVQDYYNTSYGGTEKELIEKCVGEDVHGFLVTEEKESLRRESCVRFSWAIGLPRFSDEYRRIMIVQHTRNISKIPSDAPEELRRLQMPYPRPYASDFYGFVSIADLSRIGISYTDNLEGIDQNTRKMRQKNTILAYGRMLQGEIGANLSRSLPASTPLTVFLAASKRGAIPAPIHPIYPSYLSESTKLIENAAELFRDELRVRIYAPYIDQSTKNHIISLLGEDPFVDDPYTGLRHIIDFLGL